MKKLSYVLLILFIVFSTMELSAQKRVTPVEKYSNGISANPIGLVFGFLNATYEFQVAPENSITISGYYWNFLGWTAYGLGGSYRFYIVKEETKRIIEGFSFGPAASVGFWGYETSLYSNGTSLAIGGEAAYKWVWGGFMLEPNIQLMINVLNIEGLAYRSFGLGVNIGYAW